MIDVTPAIFTNDEAILGRQIKELAPHVPWIQLDISDGGMVPSTSLVDAEKLKTILATQPAISFEAHLMVEHPVRHIKPLADAGFKRIIAQVECSDPRAFLDEAQFESVEVGLGLDGASELDIFEPFLESIDVAVIMTIEAGSPDAPFLPESLEKIMAVQHHFPDLAIAAEGNIDDQKASLLRDVGISRLIVSSSTILKDPANIAATIQALRGI